MIPVVVIGGATEDITEKGIVPGGGILYSAKTFRELGNPVTIITNIPEGHKFQSYYEDFGASLIVAPHHTSPLIQFKNTYDSQGNRVQKALGFSSKITKDDLLNVDLSRYQGSLFFVATIMDEVDMDVIPELAHYGIVAMTPQGRFRGVRHDGAVYQKKWRGFEEYMKGTVKATILSEEDIQDTHKKIDHEMLEKIKYSSDITVLTRGEYGATIYAGDRNFSVDAVHLYQEKRDYTGAGDVFAAAFLAKLTDGKDTHDAAVFATLYAAAKIANTQDGHEGIDTVPSLEFVHEFINKYPEEYRNFLKNNNMTGLNF